MLIFVNNYIYLLKQYKIILKSYARTCEAERILHPNEWQCCIKGIRIMVFNLHPFYSLDCLKTTYKISKILI